MSDRSVAHATTTATRTNASRRSKASVYMANDDVFAIQEGSVAARHEKELTAVGVWTCHVMICHVMMPYERGARKARQGCGKGAAHRNQRARSRPHERGETKEDRRGRYCKQDTGSRPL